MLLPKNRGNEMMYPKGVIKRMKNVLTKTKGIFSIVMLLLALTSLCYAVQPGKWDVTGIGESSMEGRMVAISHISFGFYVSDDETSLVFDEKFVLIADCCSFFEHTIDVEKRRKVMPFGIFSYADNVLLFTGIFDSDTTAQGTWQLETPEGLENGLLVDLSSGHWTAAYIGSQTGAECTGRIATTWGKIKIQNKTPQS